MSAQSIENFVCQINRIPTFGMTRQQKRQLTLWKIAATALLARSGFSYRQKVAQFNAILHDSQGL